MMVIFPRPMVSNLIVTSHTDIQSHTHAQTFVRRVVFRVISLDRLLQVCLYTEVRNIERKKNMFYFIGLGLGDAKDITVKGLEIVRAADRVYLEAYTSILTVGKDELVWKHVLFF